MKFGKSLSIVAAAGLAIAPVVAQANTRSSDATVSLAPIAGDASRIASPVAESEDALGKIPLWVIFLLLSLGITLEEIVTSPGIFD